MPLQPGQILNNRYQIIALLGQGGMGSVYRAFDQTLNRAVAIKERVPDPNATPQGLAQTRAQFQREAQVLANLHHDNLPRVTDYFSFGGNEYLVMDLIEGLGLDQVVRQNGATNEKTVRAWMNQVLDALIYIHSQNPPIIHRDIKPANIILKPDGKIMLVDFGLVKLLDPNNWHTLSAIRAMGTPGYAPIEQFSPGMHTDARSDIFSLGATMYHLLSGQMPMDAPRRLVDPTQIPNVRALNPKVSAQTEGVVQQAMELQPQNRFASVAEMQQALAGRLSAHAPIRTATQPGYAPAPAAVAQTVPVNPLRASRVQLLAATIVGMIVTCMLELGILFLAGIFPPQPLIAPTITRALPTRTVTAEPTATPMSTVTGVPPTRVATTPPSLTPTPVIATVTPVLMPTFTPTALPQWNTVFEDLFNDPTLDPSKWVANNPSGDAFVSGSFLRLASSSNRFPYVYPRNDPFPSQGDFRFIAQFRYVRVDTCGVGILITSFLPSPGTPLDIHNTQISSAEQSGMTAGIWQGLPDDMQIWYRSGNEKPSPRVSSRDTASHTMEILYSNSRYTISLDGRIVITTAPTSARPHTIWLGHPAVLGNSCRWSVLEIDSIRVQSLY